MKQSQKIQPNKLSKKQSEIKEDYLSQIQKKERMLSIGIYSLIIIITIALMLIILNVIVKF
jgi:hypothetical protein